METEFRMFEDDTREIYTTVGSKQHFKNIKPENPWPRYHTWILVEKINLHTQQTC